jgi:NAD(P)H-hydrate epimerase
VLKNMVGSTDILLDALLGTGTKLPLKGELKKGLERISAVIADLDEEPYVVAVDCPSGLDCDTGEIAPSALSADLTVTLAAAKTGLVRFPGAERVGEIAIADIGIQDGMQELARIRLEMPTARDLRRWLPKRPASAHKGTFGRLIVNAGSINYPGAAILAGGAAYRVGAGLVTMGVPASIMGMVVGQLPEATWLVLPHEMGVINQAAWDVLSEELEGTDALLIGPGFGREQVTRSYLEALFGQVSAGKRASIGFAGTSKADEEHDEAGEDKRALPACIIDADGLNLLSELEDWPERLPKGTILTPHPGEMSSLTGDPVEDIQADRVEVARRWAAAWGHVVLLKGAFSVIAAPDGRTAVIPFATPALARAGTGDVLAGAVAGLRTQGMAAYEAAVLGAYLHGRAGEIAADYAGSTASVLAGDVSLALAEAMAEVEFG